MAGAAVMMRAWNEWGIQALVLLSFTLQVSLLVLAEFRRRVDSGVLRFFIWSAYMMADGTAIYVLGHMSVTSRLPQHQLMAFWAPFLLLHLGGQDSITAYAIEDNRLWLRHLQTLVVQVAAAGYILYESSIISSHSLLWGATMLMFMAGVVKYGERVWVLTCADSGQMGKNYRTLQVSSRGFECSYYLDKIISTRPWDTEAYLLMAHRMLEVPGSWLKGPPPHNLSQYPFASDLLGNGKDVYKVVEMQLSLMHDVFYTKVEVIHSSLYGLCIHMLPAIATAAAFFLFQLLILGGHHRYDKLDVAVTYVLLVGAVILETASLLRAMFSSWTCPFLVRWSRANRGMEDNTVCNNLGRTITSLRRLVHAAKWRRRYWSGSMGQHNLIELSAGSRSSKRSKIARWMGVEDWWNIKAYSRSIPVPELIPDLLVNHVLKIRSGDDDDHNNLFDSKGQAELKRWGLYERGLTWSVEERVVVWHLATNVYLSWRCEKTKAENSYKAEEAAVQSLSNYMMFLLAARPYMLSPTASRDAYVEMAYALTPAGGLRCCSSAEELTRFLRAYGDAPEDERGAVRHKHGSSLDFTTQHHLQAVLDTGCELGARLIGNEESSLQDEDAAAAPEDTLGLIAQVWVEMLCHAGKQCSAYSHARQLSNGGELVTIAALLVEYTTKRILTFPR
ncbi:uncharacterized protein LOC102718017 [Oryza brachyantha]|uniref:DUF4220 domain-containing protein n=1 Tax=Oryza brachyantha TaxID=4533 RepID=J3MR27_ORYBR|nr:uncharacterized protein LOC102718017 [Oryza brachyantha]